MNNRLLMISGDRALAEGKHGAFFNTLEEFRKFWDRIDVICPRVGNNQQSTINNRFFDNVFIHPSPWPLIFQPFWILKEGQRLIKEYGHDFVTVHEYPPFYNGIGAYLLWRKTKVPYWLEIFHIIGYPKAAGLKEISYRWLTKIFINFDARRASAIRTINNNQVPSFLVRAGVPKEKIIYVPAFYIDLDIFKLMGLDKEYDLIFVGRLVKNKGVNLFLEAVKKLGLKTIIVGDGPLKESLKFKVKSLKLENQIIFHGWAKDSQEVAELMNKSKILVMSSYNEGGPRVVPEAMACGVPVLATAVGIMPEIIKSGESGEIIDWNSENIVQKVKALLDNPAQFDLYVRRGLEIARQFGKKEAIKNYAEKLQSLIRRYPP